MPKEIVGPNERLWFAHGGQNGVRSFGNYHPVREMTVSVIGDLDRHARSVAFVFNSERLAYQVEDPRQLRAIITKLIDAYGQIVGKGESKVTSFSERPDWQT